MQLLNLQIGPNAQRMCEELDNRCISIANMRAQEASNEARKLKIAMQKESEDIATTLNEEFYSPGIGD